MRFDFLFLTHNLTQCQLSGRKGTMPCSFSVLMQPDRNKDKILWHFKIRKALGSIERGLGDRLLRKKYLEILSKPC